MKFRCTICGYEYDEAKEGIAFAELPDTWQCPLCGAPKFHKNICIDGGMTRQMIYHGDQGCQFEK
jgi:rubredoxin